MRGRERSASIFAQVFLLPNQALPQQWFRSSYQLPCCCCCTLPFTAREPLRCRVRPASTTVSWTEQGSVTYNSTTERLSQSYLSLDSLAASTDLPFQPAPNAQARARSLLPSSCCVVSFRIVLLSAGSLSTFLALRCATLRHGSLAISGWAQQLGPALAPAARRRRRSTHGERASSLNFAVWVRGTESLCFPTEHLDE